MKKSSTRRTPVNLYQLFGVCTLEQDRAISKINELLFELILRSLDANGQMGVTKSRSAFEMFELGKTICDTIGLPMKTWIDSSRSPQSLGTQTARLIMPSNPAPIERYYFLVSAMQRSSLIQNKFHE